MGLPIFCNDNKIQLKLDTDITKIIEQLGEPKSISVEEFTPNTNFDTICYEYEQNLREIEVLYDKNFKAIEILYGYSTP